ncbi:MAG: zinc-ribbon domain-containing protein [Myxococcaceae bacterium]
MHIACPQCATRYELDERLLPPTGAPVQCTRCSHVFTAVPPIEEERSGPPPTKPSGGVTEGTLAYGTRPALTPAQGIPTSTQVFGRAATVTEGTQPYGRRPALTPPNGIPSGTQVFGAAISGATQPFDPRSTLQFGAGAAPERRQDPRSTHLFGALDAPKVAEAPDLRATDPEASASPGDLNAPAVARRPGAAATALLDPFDPPGRRDPESPLEHDDHDPSTELERSMRRRRNRLLIALALIALAGVGVAGFLWWSTREASLPAEAIEAQGKATRLLRRDDPKALAEAGAELEALTKKWPNHFELRSTQLIALLFQLDDARAEIARLNAEGEALNGQLARLQRRRSPADWQSRVNALEDQRQQLKLRLDPLIERASALDARANQAFRALKPGTEQMPLEQELAWVRAQALFHGVKGADQAVVLSERYRQLGGADGWADLAYAEYALNGRVPPDTRKQAQAGLEALRKRDTSFIRPWVLSGRLLLANKQAEEAVAAFENATALNPEHTLASDLLEHAQRVRAEAAGQN